VIAQLSAIEVAKPADLIMRQIRNLISSGTLQSGDRLPSERELAERFCVGRGHVREALRKLEFYGVLRTFPQSGTVVASLGAGALERLISNLLDLDRDDVDSLMETRGILELHTAQLACERAGAQDIAEIGRTLDAFAAEVDAGRFGLDEDLVFHLAIAKAARNPIMLSLIGLITPDVIRLNRDYRLCEAGRARASLDEHRAIYAAISQRDPAAARSAMAAHLNMTSAQFAAKASVPKTAPRRRSKA